MIATERFIWTATSLHLTAEIMALTMFDHAYTSMRIWTHELFAEKMLLRLGN